MSMATQLDAGQLLTIAQDETGLSDWSDDTLPKRFAMAVDRINASGMDEGGVAKARQHCLTLLTTRLKFFDDHKRYPLGDEVIRAPMFATGETRSGTTLMHALMAADPTSRALRFAEVAYPSPPPGVAAADDPRWRQADNDWREVNRLQSSWLRAHPYNDMLGNGLPECERTWAFDFRIMTADAWLSTPLNTVDDLPVDYPAQYRIHKMMLQALQYERPERPWVLKGFHGFRLKELFAAYPDAKIVWLHRDPVQTAASCAMMIQHIYDGVMSIDLDDAARATIARVRSGVVNTMASPFVDDPRIYHLRYHDFVQDPVEAVRGYYQFCDRELTHAGEAAMRDYLANNRADRHGKFHYSVDVLTNIGEELPALHEEFRPYRERFGLDAESRG